MSLLFVLFTALVLGKPLCAHDLEIGVQLAAPVVITRATYAGRDPASFAQVAIRKSDSKTEHQTGRTDLNGYFSFVPDGPGSWLVTVDDELGHRKEVTVSIPSPFGSNSEAAVPGFSLPQKALLGLALIVGLTGLLYGYKARAAGSGRPERRR